MKKAQLILKHNRVLNETTHLLSFSLDPESCAECRPGQFFNLRALDSSAPLLRRPISICDVRASKGEMDLLVRKVGEGTRLVCGHLPGESLDAVGPLGASFPVDVSRPALMIAGGVGVAPVFFLARRIRSEARAKGLTPPPITFCYGARTARDFVLLDRLEESVDQLILTTEDGSRGARGYVTQAAEAFLTPETGIYVCGPTPMMQAALGMVQKRGLEAFLSLENQMGCGVGACMGCVVPGREGLIRVCHDGPVVSSNKLDRLLVE